MFGARAASSFGRRGAKRRGKGRLLWHRSARWGLLGGTLGGESVVLGCHLLDPKDPLHEVSSVRCRPQNTVKCQQRGNSTKLTLQLVYRVITPPKMGPDTPETPTTSPAMAPIHFFISLGLISGKITIASEYNPDPPTPCSALRTMS